MEAARVLFVLVICEGHTLHTTVRPLLMSVNVVHAGTVLVAAAETVFQCTDIEHGHALKPFSTLFPALRRKSDWGDMGGWHNAGLCAVTWHALEL